MRPGGVRPPGRAPGGERGDDRRRGRAPSCAGQRDEARPSSQRLGAALGERARRGRGAARARRSATAIEAKLERLERRREQLGPVNPLAKREYEEALAHVEELAEQRTDLETALRELRALIRGPTARSPRPSRRPSRPRPEASRSWSAELFPGGPRPAAPRRRRRRAPARSRARRPSREDGREAEPDGARRRRDEDGGVEIEITPAGKSTRRLSLLSGGEKSLIALAFVFAVFLARPCPFYILDEVEAALDDLNIDRFLRLVRRFADRAQFIVVTHQKRTMEAADILYGVSMGGDGVTKVVSRKLPRDELGTGLEPTAGLWRRRRWAARRCRAA